MAEPAAAAAAEYHYSEAYDDTNYHNDDECFDPLVPPRRYTEVIQSPTGGIGPRWDVAPPPGVDPRLWVPKSFPQGLRNDTVSCCVKEQIKGIVCSSPFNMNPDWDMKQIIDAIDGRFPPYIIDTLRKLNRIRNDFEHPEKKTTPPTLGIPHLYWQDVQIVMLTLEHVEMTGDSEAKWPIPRPR